MEIKWTHKNIISKGGREKKNNIIIKEKQIKTTVKYHLTLIRMAITKKSTNIKKEKAGVINQLYLNF